MFASIANHVFSIIINVFYIQRVLRGKLFEPQRLSMSTFLVPTQASSFP